MGGAHIGEDRRNHDIFLGKDPTRGGSHVYAQQCMDLGSFPHQVVTPNGTRWSTGALAATGEYVLLNLQRVCSLVSP